MNPRPQEIRISDYSYELPQDRIAQHALPIRDSSKLLVYNNNKIRDDIFSALPGYLPEKSLLVLNDTRVVHARLLFQKPTGGKVEVFCLAPDTMYPDMATALSQQGGVRWHCMVGGAARWREEAALSLQEGDLTVQARLITRNDEGFLLEFTWQDAALTFAEVLHRAGHVPLPPYMKRADDTADAQRYQTVFSRQEGSVAAPTASLHFTDEVFNALTAKKIARLHLTLHVGAGTFAPVKADTMDGHRMHSERLYISREGLQQLISNKHPVVASGTTAMRSLESIYIAGCKLLRGENPEVIGQWDGFADNTAAKEAALNALLQHMDKQRQDYFHAATSLLIAPGYRFRMADAIITNFHQPQSTLLLLVAAFVGKDAMHRIYDHALENGYRFLSYGDSSLLWGSLPE